VSWIESKANFGDVVEMKKNISKQLLPYVKLFGKGIVVYWFGYVTDVEPPDGITVVDARFFTEAGHVAPTGIGSKAVEPVPEDSAAPRHPAQSPAHPPSPRKEEGHRQRPAVPSCIGGRVSGPAVEGHRPRMHSQSERPPQAHERRREHDWKRPEEATHERRRDLDVKRTEEAARERRREHEGRPPASDRKREPEGKKPDEPEPRKSKRSLFGVLE